MAKTETQVADNMAIAATPVDTFGLGIDEFCSRLSATDKRVELIGAFYHDEKMAGNAKSTAAAYAARFAAFTTRPV